MAEIRIKEYNKWIYNNSFKEQYYTLIYELFKPIIYKKFCPICRNKNLKWKNGDDFMKYNGFELDNYGKAIKCPCENEEVHYGSYCIICGKY